MIKIKDEHIAKLLNKIEKDRDILKELNFDLTISVNMNRTCEAITLTKEEVDFNDHLITEYVFYCGELTKKIILNNKLIRYIKLGIYDHFLVLSNTMYCAVGFIDDEKDDIISLYNKIIEANKTLKSLEGFA